MRTDKPTAHIAVDEQKPDALRVSRCPPHHVHLCCWSVLARRENLYSRIFSTLFTKMIPPSGVDNFHHPDAMNCIESQRRSTDRARRLQCRVNATKNKTIGDTEFCRREFRPTPFGVFSRKSRRCATSNSRCLLIPVCYFCGADPISWKLVTRVNRTCLRRRLHSV